MKKIYLLFMITTATVYGDDYLSSAIDSEFARIGSPFIVKADSRDIKIIAKYTSEKLKRTWYATEFNKSTGMFMVFFALGKEWHFGQLSLAEVKMLSAGYDKEFIAGVYTLKQLIEGERP
jgi:hypothetical protein